MNIMPTIAYLNMLVLGGRSSVLVWAGIAHGFRCNLILIQRNWNAKHYQDEILARYVIPPFQIMPISLFFSMMIPQAIQLGTLNFLRANIIAFINDWTPKGPNLNPIEHFWDNLDQRVRRCPFPPSNIIQLRQAFVQE